MKKIIILLGLLLAITSINAYVIPSGTFNIYESVGHYHKALVERNCINASEYITNSNVYDLQTQYYNKYIECILNPKYIYNYVGMELKEKLKC